jgi:uncharacterized protein (DUF924 family)
MRKLKVKYAEYTLIPREAYQGDGEYETSDCQKVTAKSVGIYNGEDRVYLDKIAMRLFNIPFSHVEKVWKGRIGVIKGVWLRIKMQKNGTDA